MKRWGVYFTGLLVLALLSKTPFAGSDVALLKPVEVLRVTGEDGQIRVETDTGDFGTGSDLSAAFADLKATTAGDVFLDTADYLILSSDTVPLLPELAEYLRPGCGVCVELGRTDTENAAAFLAAHPLAVTLRDCRAENPKLPLLLTGEEGMYLVQ